MEGGAATASAAPPSDPAAHAPETDLFCFVGDCPPEIVPSPRGQKCARAAPDDDDDEDATGAARGSPRRAGIDFLGVVNEEEEAFLEELKAAISDDNDAPPGSSFAGATADQEVDTTLRLGLGSHAAELGDDGGGEEAHDESLSAFLAAMLAARGDDHLPLEFEEDTVDSTPPPPREFDGFALTPEDEGFLLLLEAATDSFDVQHQTHAAAADGATAPSSGLDLNQPCASPADEEESVVSGVDDDELPVTVHRRLRSTAPHETSPVQARLVEYI